MNTVEKLSRLLSLPVMYRAFRALLGGTAAWEVYVKEYVKPKVDERVLDLGCGPADVLDYLPKLNYTGLDNNPQYIESAQKRFGEKGRFWCKDVGVAALGPERGTFDLVLATGIVHHLDDQQAVAMFDLAREALRPQGRLITFDGCYAPEQSPITRWLLGNDRGRFVRSEAEYRRLALGGFRNVESHVRHDLLRVPYTHCIMCCIN